MTFTAIDFETATKELSSACAVGIVTVNDGVITEEYSTLIQPPFNEYAYHNIKVHGITPDDTRDTPTFPEVFPEIQKRLQGRLLVAHNAGFDKAVLYETMKEYHLYYDELEIQFWTCTLKMYRQLGYKPTNLKYCCDRQGIALNHHEALSDARGCAKLYLRGNNTLF